MKTRLDAVETIRSLLGDLKGNPDSWENPSLERYLDAMAAWLEDEGAKADHAITWDHFIDLLWAAKIYE